MYSLSQIKRGVLNPSLALQHLHYQTDDRRERLLAKLTGPRDGVDVMAEDWDNLVILDACRYDIFEEVNWLRGDLQKRISRGSATPTFIMENFSGRKYYDTVLISANAVIGQYRDEIEVYKLEGLWGEVPDDQDIEYPNDNTHPLSLVDPEPVVESAIEAHEAHPNKRLVVHFLPPHTPFLIKDGQPIPPKSPYRTFSGVRNGEVSRAEIRWVYKENVAYVLEYVEELVSALDGKTVVTSDHGELLGEGIPLRYRLLDTRWPLSKLNHYNYAHYKNVRVPELVEIPWLEIEGESRRTIEAADTPEGVDIDESAIADQLEALGYR